MLFGEQLSRVELAKVDTAGALEKRRIRVHRNHAFEHVGSAAAPFFAWYGLSVEYVFSDYDDSLTFQVSAEEGMDLEVLWIDASRYADRLNEEEFVEWLSGRVGALRQVSRAPVLVVPVLCSRKVMERWGTGLGASPMAGVRWADVREILDPLGDRMVDDRAARFSGTRLSDRSCLLLARAFACRWVPAMLFPRIKAVAVDLDHTLVQGVVGEDGEAVKLTDGHRVLHERLLELRDSGLFLALVSRNELSDVKNLFDARPDFPLRWESFHAHWVNWGEKSDALKSIATALNIGLDAVLYLDDNPGELAAIHEQCPMVSLIHASQDARGTVQILNHSPRLWTWGHGETDALRGQDIIARQQRLEMSNAAPDPIEYLRSLNVELGFIEKPDHHYTGRIFELSQKTNQFNLNLQRLSEVDVESQLTSPHVGIVLSRLKDRLSDSGIIGLVIGYKQQNTLIIQELAISCRALGRRIENILIVHSIKCLMRQLATSHVQVQYATGLRNAPARDWLTQFSGTELDAQGAIDLTPQINDFNEEAFPVTLIQL